MTGFILPFVPLFIYFSFLFDVSLWSAARTWSRRIEKKFSFYLFSLFSSPMSIQHFPVAQKAFELWNEFRRKVHYLIKFLWFFVALYLLMPLKWIPVNPSQSRIVQLNENQIVLKIFLTTDIVGHWRNYIESQSLKGLSELFVIFNI